MSDPTSFPVETPYHSPPRYCMKDGYALEQSQHIITQRYDPFTGQAAPVTMLMLRCNNQANPSAGWGHDIWVLKGETWVLEQEIR